MASSRLTKLQSPPLPRDLADLTAAVAALPTDQRNRLEPICQRVVDSTRRRQRILSLVQEALGQLRLDMKYLLFDLEATRRERNFFREALDEGDET